MYVCIYGSLHTSLNILSSLFFLLSSFFSHPESCLKIKFLKKTKRCFRERPLEGPGRGGKMKTHEKQKKKQNEKLNNNNNKKHEKTKWEN